MGLACANLRLAFQMQATRERRPGSVFGCRQKNADQPGTGSAGNHRLASQPQAPSCIR